MAATAIAAIESPIHAVDPDAAPASVWPLWKRVGFRFIFAYLLLQITPWEWFSAIPGTSFVLNRYPRAVDLAVRLSNDHIFHDAV